MPNARNGGPLAETATSQTHGNSTSLGLVHTLQPGYSPSSSSPTNTSNDMNTNTISNSTHMNVNSDGSRSNHSRNVSDNDNDNDNESADEQQFRVSSSQCTTPPESSVLLSALSSSEPTVQLNTSSPISIHGKEQADVMHSRESDESSELNTDNTLTRHLQGSRNDGQISTTNATNAANDESMERHRSEYGQDREMDRQTGSNMNGINTPPANSNGHTQNTASASLLKNDPNSRIHKQFLTTSRIHSNSLEQSNQGGIPSSSSFGHMQSSANANNEKGQNGNNTKNNKGNSSNSSHRNTANESHSKFNGEDSQKDQSSSPTLTQPEAHFSLLETKYNDLWFQRTIPIQTSSYLRPGSKFVGTQQSGTNSYEVEVVLKYVDMRTQFLSGYLKIRGLTQQQGIMETYFEGEMISDKHSFFTRREDWNASDQVDRNHWGRFSSWRELAVRTRIDAEYVHTRFETRKHIYMRWKEYFLVPDYRVTKLKGVAYDGFYYICFNQQSGGVTGVYYHNSSQSYQQLDLQHCPDNGTWPSYEFR